MTKCLKCEKHFNNEILAIAHAKKEHNILKPQWKLLYDHNGIIPLCKCGCGMNVKFCCSDGKWSTYIRGHHMREQYEREKMSKSIQKALQNPEMTKNISVGVRKHLLTTKQVHKKNSYTFAVNDLVTQELCYLHSSWELLMWVYARDSQIKLLRNHKIIIPYVHNDKERFYIPDFKIDDKIIEIKGWADESVKFKELAANKWCQQRNFKYVVLTSEKMISNEFPNSNHNMIKQIRDELKLSTRLISSSRHKTC